MRAGSLMLRAVTVFLGVALLCGCTAPRQSVKAQRTPEEPNEKPVTVRLPALSPFKIESPPTVPPPDQSVSPSDVQDGIARSTNLFEFTYTGGKIKPPIEEGLGPPDDVVPDVETP